MGFGGGPSITAPVKEPEEKKRTAVDPNRDEQIAQAARRRAEIAKRRSRNALRTDDASASNVTRGGTTTVG